MSDSPVSQVAQRIDTALAGLAEVAGMGTGDGDLLTLLTLCEAAARRVDRLLVGVLAEVERRGVFADRGYRSSAAALGDLLGWDRAEARRRLAAAPLVRPRIGLDGAPLPPRLAATATVFEAGEAGLRQVEIVARLLETTAAERLTPDVWAGAEAQLAAWCRECTPAELAARGAQLIEALDTDGPAPDDDDRSSSVNELHLRANRVGGGGRLIGRFDDAAMFDTISALLDAQAKPRSAEDDRTPAQRQAHALADACGYVLEYADVPATGGRRPVLTVTIRLDDLENRCRSAMLDFAGLLTPDALRMAACDAAVIPIVLDGHGLPLDVGRATRVVPEGLRRAVIARDGGCARCGRPASWCEVHHIQPWQNGGETALTNCVLLCKACHRLVHHAGWSVRLRDGRPEFRPPSWIDPQRRPRGRPCDLILDVGQRIPGRPFTAPTCEERFGQRVATG
jgi:Domain of unknown function (DUF222)/HNH endonuclease